MSATEVSPLIDRIGPTQRPGERVIGYHTWSNLLFVHWRVPAEVIRPLLPRELTLDTWQGDAWVGLVPFDMSRIRPWWSPPIPGISWFCETNVRTYVHLNGRDPGVWFMSLDASSSLAVRVARWRWHLPYYRAEMSLAREGPCVRYRSRRLWPGRSGAGCEISASVGPLLREGLPTPLHPAGQAEPDTLEHFLIERYILYAQRKNGQLLAGRVHHRPYPIREARLTSLRESLLEACSIREQGPVCHTAFSDGVDVEIFPLLRV